ncbi:response regulator transcription factor [Microbacterium karelineae]|uniref:response regulator transcription factor n=1 Tax=Microbacterium karelineae TaxID=2654283 RepID=UPI0012EA840A|nr:response regulator transcription factor [Microbacterium karelineae]
MALSTDAEADTAESPLARVLVVDDDPIVRQAVTLLTDALANARVVGEAVDGREAIARAREHRPDVVIMDVSMPRVGGPEATAEIVAALPHTRVIAMTSLGAEEALMRMIEAGARGFLVKDRVFDELQNAIDAVMNGDGFLSPRATAQLLRRRAEMSGDAERRLAVTRFETLTARERDVAVRVAAGDSNPEIAARLFVSASTVKTHLEQVSMKLGVTGRPQIAIVVDRAGHGPAFD